MVHRKSGLESASGLRDRLGCLRRGEVSVAVADASKRLVTLSETQLGSAQKPILPDICIDRRIQRSGTDVGCLARNGETAGCANSGDAATPEALVAKRGILAVVGAVVEAFAAPADSCRYHAATAEPGRRL
jgi:hypothetical protein